MLLKAHLTSYCRMSVSTCVITPSWLSGSWRSFLYSSFMYSCHLFLISSASVRSIPLLSFILAIFAFPWYLLSFLEEISSLSHSNVFFYFFALVTEEVLSLLALLWNSAFRWVYLSFSPLSFAYLLFSAICKASSVNHFSFLHFFFLGMVLIPASYKMPWTSIYSSSGTLSDLVPESICHFHCIILRDLSYIIPEWFSVFPYFLQFKSEFCSEFMIWATVSSLSCFWWLYRAYSSLAAKNIINLSSVLTIWWYPCVVSSLVFLEEDVCCDQCVLLVKLCWPFPCFILYSNAKFACCFRYL